jgi:putative transposase
MPNTYSNIYIHIIFSVKERRNLLNSKILPQLCEYLGGIAKKNNFKTIITNGTENHIHTLILLKPHISISKAVQLLKGGSSKWIRNNLPDLKIFSWQEGYGAFAVSTSQVGMVKNYIRNQQEHHKKKDFKEEYREFLHKNNIEFDEKYLF